MEWTNEEKVEFIDYCLNYYNDKTKKSKGLCRLIATYKDYYYTNGFEKIFPELNKEILIRKNKRYKKQEKSETWINCAYSWDVLDKISRIEFLTKFRTNFIS